MPRQTARLEIVSAVESTRVVPIDRTPFSIGSNPDSDLRLAAAGVAPVHARIVRLAGVHHLLPGPSPAPLIAGGRGDQP